MPIQKRNWSHADDTALAEHYFKGVAIDTMIKQFQASRSSIYRRLRILGVPAREPKKKSAGYYVDILISPVAHPLVKTLFELAKVERMNTVYLAKNSGVCRETISHWARGSEPSIQNLRAVGSVVGVQLIWTRT